MNEADLKRKLVWEVNAVPNAYARRIEDRWAVGALDLIIKLPDIPMFFAEGKVFDGNVFGPTKRQYVEGKKLIAANVVALLIGWRGGVMHISPWIVQANKKECYVNHDSNYAETLMRYMQNTLQ